jgi:CRISPR-associated protein Cmr2
MTDKLWKAKLAAWCHDPAEKALVLLRDPTGHEGGTVRNLRQQLFPDGLGTDLHNWVKKADHWASAADRPQFPRSEKDGRYVAWSQVRFTDQPELIHPLSGSQIDISNLKEIEPSAIKAISIDHFSNLIQKDDAGVNLCRTAIAFWRFAPELAAHDLASLWRLLPADTRVPDHSIWSHLDLSSAFAGAFAADSNATPALLSISFGPVQGFIAQARTTSDLWAGSHLLSRLAWEGLKVVCAQCGPDSVVFPQLRGIPLVDLWLRDEMGLPDTLFKECEWQKKQTDVNPLFGAALPNKFMAIVPQDQAADLARTVTEKVRQWIQEEAVATVETLLKEADLKLDRSYACFEQVQEQLQGFPEVTWAAVPWSLVSEKDSGLGIEELEKALAPFYSVKGKAPGFMNTRAWQLLSKELQVEGARFFHPNSGVLYPALYDLLDRLGAASKAIRPFYQNPQKGFRCSLCGENEWLSTEREQLYLSPGKREDAKTLWSKIAASRPSWSRKGEHLCALCALKRLWPSRFASQMRDATGGDAQRFVVSTHTMALASSLGRWLEQDTNKRKPLPLPLKSCLEGTKEQAALPRRMAVQLAQENEEANLLARRLPILLDELGEKGAEKEKEAIDDLVKKVLGNRPEAYYAMILLDGDNMGAWLNGNEEKYSLSYHDSWHTQIRTAADRFKEDADMQTYLQSRRPPSPARHMAISSALNGFALDLVRHVVEDMYKGKLLYAGGDDVMAMIAIDDLLPAMFMLRLIYGGFFAPEAEQDEAWSRLFRQESKMRLKMAKGHVFYKKRLYQVMGEKATASAGAVIAHHTTPLSLVLRELRLAEKAAKNKGGRDSFAIRLLKRAGGDVHLVAPWFTTPHTDRGQLRSLVDSPMGQLIRLQQTLAGDEFSRRATYLVQQWAQHLPDANLLEGEEAYLSLLQTTLAHQFARQSSSADKEKNSQQARQLAQLAMSCDGRTDTTRPDVFLVNFLSIAEFLARQGRGEQQEKEHAHV